jgi:hypothetical protein
MKKLLCAAMLATVMMPMASAQSSDLELGTGIPNEMPFVAQTVPSSPPDAGTCRDEIAQLQRAARASMSNGVGLSAPQTVGAQLGYQPTPASIAQAQGQARARFESILAHAKALGAAGQHAECLQTAAEAKELLAPE